jgi:hypothetical protein
METLRTSEIGKRLQAEWPAAYTALQIEMNCHVGIPPRLGEIKLYHEEVSWHSAPTLEGCIAKVHEALAVKSGAKPPPRAEVVIELPAEAVSD